MSDRFTNDDLADAERRAALGEALAGRSFALTVREVSPEHRTGWCMAAEFPDGVAFDFDHVAGGQTPAAGAELGQAQVEVREVEGRWRFVVAAIGGAAPGSDQPAESAAPAGDEVQAGPELPAPAEAAARPAEAQPGEPAQAEKRPQAPRVVRGDELLRRVLQLLVRRAREGRRAPSPKLKTAVTDGRALGVDLAVLERWLPSVEQALQLDGRARVWLEEALAKRPSAERADARERLHCLLETFDRAGQPLANLARRAFADRERRPQARPGRPPGARPARTAPAPDDAAADVEAADGPAPKALPETGAADAAPVQVEVREAQAGSSEAALPSGD